jgi:hypothetical protein
MRRLERCDQERDADRAQQRDLSEKRLGGMLRAFCRQLPSHLPTCHELLIELLRATTHTHLRQLFQPPGTVARSIDSFSSAGGRPTSIEGFDPIKPRVRIFGHGKTAAAHSRCEWEPQRAELPRPEKYKKGRWPGLKRSAESCDLPIERDPAA